MDVVAPWLCEDLARLLSEGRLDWVPREYAEGDLVGAWLVHTCTGDRAIDAAVASAAAERDGVVRPGRRRGRLLGVDARRRPGRRCERRGGGGGDPRRAAAVRDAVQLLLDTGQLPVRPRRPAPAGRGRVALIGGGPGDRGLITTRGRHLLAEADVVVVDRLAPERCSTSSTRQSRSSMRARHRMRTR